MVYVQWKRHLEQIVLKKLTVGMCMCMHTLNAYGSSVTQLVTHTEGSPFFSHLVKQLASKLMEGWLMAQDHDRLAGSLEPKPLA